ncbi:hypothetical protein BG015_009585 [Linnemannia schmuckeri]|uniref:Uncharacterized protein n=1 Tax=Linnemannia schmuckeri TaxID=64567 RepID=A0A9P5V9U4_9FUNG|nr:hypothetical protein BG015_009585 [Linnemannia schmuckeri]
MSGDWAFFGHKLLADVIIRALPNRVTTLEILGPCDTLHDFLCDSPQLLHLKTPWITVLPYHLDLHLCWDHGDGRMIDYGCRAISDALKICVCRGLQTLHMGAQFYDRYAPGYNDYSLFLSAALPESVLCCKISLSLVPSRNQPQEGLLALATLSGRTW